MMNKIRKIIEQFKTSKFFRTTITSYFLIGCVSLILFSSIIIWSIKNASVKQINDINLTMLTQASNTGTLVFENICNKFLKEFSNNSLVITAMCDNEMTLEQQSSLNTLFQNYLSENNILGSISVFNLKAGIEYTQYSEKYSPKQKIRDNDMAERLRNFKPNDEMIFSRQVHINTGQQDDDISLKYITVVFRIDNNSALVINIDQQSFDKLINMPFRSNMQQTVLFNNRKNVISGTISELSEEQIEHIYRLTADPKKTSGSLSFGHKLVSFVKSDYLNYTYVTIYNTKQSTGFDIYLILFTICSAVILSLLNLIFGVFYSQRLYRPVNEIVNKLYKKEQIKPAEVNELDLIYKHVSKLKNEYHSLQKVENKYVMSQRNRILRGLLHGNITPHSKLYNDLFAECNISFTHGYFTLVTFKVDWSYFDADIETDIDADLLNYAVMNIGCELFNAVCPVFGVEGENTFILNHPQNRFDGADAVKELRDTIASIQTYIKKYFDITLTIIVGENAVSLSDIPAAFNHIKYAELYCLVFEPSSVIYYQDVMKRLETDAVYPQEAEDNVIKALRMEDFDAIAENIARFINELKELEYNKIFFFVTQLILDLGKSFKEIYNTETEIPDINIVDMINDIETLDEIKDIVFNYCKDISENLTHTQFNKKDSITKSIIDFVEQNYRNPALNIDMIASDLGYSPNYVRSLFKNACNISLSNYINNRRFEEIYYLLKQTNLSVKEICEMVGLKYGGYFHTAFKKRTGFTPDTYRSMHKKA